MDNLVGYSGIRNRVVGYLIYFYERICGVVGGLDSFYPNYLLPTLLIFIRSNSLEPLPCTCSTLSSIISLTRYIDILSPTTVYHILLSTNEHSYILVVKTRNLHKFSFQFIRPILRCHSANLLKHATVAVDWISFALGMIGYPFVICV